MWLGSGVAQGNPSKPDSEQAKLDNNLDPNGKSAGSEKESSNALTVREYPTPSFNVEKHNPREKKSLTFR